MGSRLATGLGATPNILSGAAYRFVAREAQLAGDARNAEAPAAKQ